MIAKEIFKVGNHGISWVDPDFISRYGEEEVEEDTIVPGFKKLEKAMYDSEIDTELKPSKSTLGHVLAFIKNPPEGTKDGWSNIFYVGAFVVSVRWCGDGWRVDSWPRGGHRWGDSSRVFSPAFGSVSLETKPSDALTLISEIEERLKVLKKLI